MDPIPRIASPCHESWAGMSPAVGGRHCASCAKTVVDLTVLPPPAADAYLRRLSHSLATAPGTSVCVRARLDPRGRLTGGRLLTNALAAMLAVAVSGCTGSGPQASSAPPPSDSSQPRSAATTSLAEPQSALCGELPPFQAEDPVVELGPLNLDDAVAEPEQPVHVMGMMAAPPIPVAPTPRVDPDPAPEGNG